jgi:hypothetical protein
VAQDEIVTVSATKEETMEDTRPEDDIRHDIIGFIDKFEASDRGKNISREKKSKLNSY